MLPSSSSTAMAPVAVHHHEVALLVGHGAEVEKNDGAAVLRLERALFADPRCRTTDVERPHGELRTRLTDRLRRDDADGLALFDQLAGREAAAVALLTHAAHRLAGQHRADLDLLESGILNLGGELDVDFLTRLTQHIVGKGIFDVLESHATDDAITQRLDDLAALDDGRDEDAVERAAVVVGDDHILGDVDQTPGQIARVGRLQRRVRQSLARTVRRDEVLRDGQSLAEVGRNRRLDDLARGLGHQATHTGELANLLGRTSRTGVGHAVDGVRRAFEVGFLHLTEHRLGDLLGNVRPDGDDLVVALTIGDRLPRGTAARPRPLAGGQSRQAFP